MYRKTLIFIIGIIYINTSAVFGQRYWVSTTGGNWSNAANWSLTSGGPGGAGAPAGVPAIFDGAAGATGNCTVDVNVAVTGFSTSNLYNGTIYQGASNIVITGNSNWGSGIFLGGTAGMTNTGILSITGANFTSTSSTFIIRGNFNLTSGSFSHNNGTVVFNNNSLAINGSPVFNNLQFSSASNIISVNSSFKVIGNFTLDGSNGTSLVAQLAAAVTITVEGTTSLTGSGYINVNTGTISTKGDLIISNTHTGGGGTGTFLISGNNTQLFSNTGSLGQGRLPSVIIDKPSSSILNISGIVTVIGPNWTYISGIVNPGSSYVNFTKQAGGSNIVISGTHTLYDASISSSYAFTTINDHLTLNGNLTLNGTTSNDVNINSTVTVLGNLYVNGTNYVNINTGLLDVKGDITNTNNGWAATGTGTVSITGTGNQLWACSGAVDGQGTFPNILINKPSGTLSLSGLINSLGPKWTYSAGTISPGSSTVCIYDNGSNPITISGTHTLNDMIIYPFNSTNVINNNLTLRNLVIDGSSNHNLNITNTVTVNGNLTINGTNQVRLNNGLIQVKGNISTINTNVTSGGTATLLIGGTLNQNISGTGVANQSRLPSTTIINKPSGSLFISGGVPFYFYNTVHFVQGQVISTSSQLAYFYSGSSAIGANALSFVSGPVRKRGNTAFVFPSGKSGLYAPIAISAPGNVTDVFTAEYYNQNPNSLYNVLSKDASLNNVSTCEYWNLNRNTGTSNVTVTLSWDTRSCGVTNLTDLRVARWDGTTWRNHGNSGTFGSTSAGTILSGSVVSSFVGPFTLASIGFSNPLPVELSSFESKCTPDGVEVKWITATEKSLDYFVLEKSMDAFTWVGINQQESSHNSQLQRHYSFVDKDVTFKNTYYYRLKQVDETGDFRHSPISDVINCEMMSDAKIDVVKQFEFGIYSVNKITAKAVIYIYDISGRKLLETISNGNSMVIDLSDHPTGIYLLHYSNNGVNETIKLIQ